jgi:Membrane bound beta barrel domain (DUF5777)
LPKFKSAFRVTHRFARPLSVDFGSLAADLFGLDSGAQIGLEYRFGIVPNGEIGIHRTSDRTIEFFSQYRDRPGVNTDDENSHVHFLNAYLESKGEQPVNFDQFRTLPGSQASGAQPIGRLTNLMQLAVDTSWWTRYRSHTKNPDLGDSFAQAVPGLATGEHPAIPRSDADLKPDAHIQAIANTAGFHFATIEQGGTSLYPALAQRVTDPEVLRVVLSIGPTEAFHFQTWQDKAGNAPEITDPETGLEFPNLKESSNEELKANLIMPEPTVFLRKSLPIVSIIRPTATQGIAKGVVEFLTAMGLFKGQSEGFFNTLKKLAAEADAAKPKR